MNNKEYLNKYLGGRIDYDSAYGYQCVDLARDYIAKVTGYTKAGRFGNANENYNNLVGFYSDEWEKMSVNELREGDVIHNIEGRYGHVAIFQKFVGKDKVEVLEQNAGSGNGDGKGNNAIRLQVYNKSYFVGGWRKKQKSKYTELFERLKKQTGLKPIFDKHEGDNYLTEREVKELIDIALFNVRGS